MSGPEIAVEVVETRGSTPREVGAVLHVSKDRIRGTIGGGALEWEAIRIARAMLDGAQTQRRVTLPLGPDLGQCCGGVVVLEFGRAPGPRSTMALPAYLWGAGHVGRAIAAILAPIESISVMLIDDAPARLPNPLPAGVTPLIAVEMPRAVTHLDRAGTHIIATYSHDIDLSLCDALLRHGFAQCGLIGSATKWARFRKRLLQIGHSGAEISRIHCPIGDPSLGKHPQAIAIGVAARLLDRQLLEESANVPASGGI